MGLIELLLIIVLVFFVLILVLFPNFRKKLKTMTSGFLNVFIEDKAKTPEGARAIFAEAIEEAQDKYNSANDTYRKLYGKLTHMKNMKEQSQTKLKECEAACENLVKAGRLEAAQVKAEEREELIRACTIYSKAVTDLEPRVQDAATIQNECEKQLKKLKQQSKEVVQGLEMNKQMQEIYDDLDELKKTTTTSKLLEHVNDAFEESQNSVAGAKAVHENKVSTKVAKANAEADKVKTNDYLETLKAKYNK